MKRIDALDIFQAFTDGMIPRHQTDMADKNLYSFKDIFLTVECMIASDSKFPDVLFLSDWEL